MMTESQASKILLDISFGNVWFYRENHAEAADTLVNAYRKLKSRVTVAENTNDEHVQTITKLQSQLAKENTRNQELEEIIQKQKKLATDAVNNETRVRELEALFKTLENANESLIADADQYQKDLYDLQEIYTKERDENDALEHDLDKLTKDKKELEEQIERLETHCRVLERVF
jgi:DNA repair exonuclease SbcCD ATPase subunit